MVTLEELEARVIALEKVSLDFIVQNLKDIQTEQLTARGRMTVLAARLDGVEGGLHARFNTLEGRLAGLETNMNARFDGVNARFDGVNARFDGIEALLSELKSSRQ
jgi:hypothetical protein